MRAWGWALCVVAIVACGSDGDGGSPSVDEDAAAAPEGGVGAEAGSNADGGADHASGDADVSRALTLAVSPPDVAVARGSSATVKVDVARTGPAGDVAIAVSGLPAGITAKPLTIAATEASGSLVLDAAIGASAAGPTVATVTATQVGGGTATATFNVSLSVGGDVDTTFGTAGWSTVGVGVSSDVPSAMAIQADGKILVGGLCLQRGTAVARYLASGALDTTFGTNGVSFPNAAGFVDGIGVQSNGAVVVLTGATLIRLTASGATDASFGNAGAVAVSGASANAIAVQPDDKIVVVGEASNKFFVERFSADGTPDATFGTAGIVTTTVESTAAANSVALQTSGATTTAILVAGTSHAGVGLDAFSVARYSGVDGSLDTSFDTDGIATTNIDSYDTVGGVAVQSDGKVIVGGTTKKFATAVERVFAIMRYTTSGALDTSFNTTGIVRQDVSGFQGETFTGLAVRGNRIVAVGNSGSSGPSLTYDFLALKVSDGTVDTGFQPTFGGSFAGQAGARAVAIQSDDKVVVVGGAISDGYGRNPDFEVIRLTTTGAVDTTFGGTGLVRTNLSNADDVFHAAAMQPDGKIVAVGTTFNGNETDFLVARFLPNGALDTSFDGDGIVTTSIYQNPDAAYAVAIQADGKIVVAGETFQGFYSMAIARYNANGSLDTTFNSSGTVTRSDARARGVVVQADGKIVVAGMSGAASIFIAERFEANGANDNSFTADAVNPSGTGTGGGGRGLVLRTDGTMIATGSAGLSLALVAWSAAGTLDSSFDVDGRAQLPFGDSAMGQALALQSTGRIVVGGRSTTAQSDFLLARVGTAGALDTSFGTAGSTVTSFGATDSIINGLTVLADDRIVVAGTVGTTPTAYTVARYDAKGVLDPAFATAGIGSYVYPSGRLASAEGIVHQSDGKVVIVGAVAKPGESTRGGLLRVTNP